MALILYNGIPMAKKGGCDVWALRMTAPQED
jgi:hypothetical protein